ncbi:hypothetical protein GCM10022223_26110 [Kineosporia mesophila]|uniref:DUF4365 domain-containing protein n=1 Tax=Kineosporia mesophila TaxID=566012 RepID=A0ABP6ZIR3_9ACTN|nr:DUF4365 domain-containing protein [Kineosporia mesophila]MCD5350504.1 DUF4365 domain-containing protein [Kineosporia mesophila]
MVGRAGDANALQGAFGEQWLCMAAASWGYQYGRPAFLDLDKTDVQLSLLGEHWGCYSPTVQIQVKTVSGVSASGTEISYSLDVPTYDVLRRTDHSIRRLLVVVIVRDDDDRARLHEDGLLVLAHGYWMSLESLPATTNTSTRVVHVPTKNKIDEEGLERMLRENAAPRSTSVPDFDPWEMA